MSVDILVNQMTVSPFIICLQIASAVKEIVSKAGGDNFPHIICGDFNSPPMTPGYLVASDGYPSGDEVITKLMDIKRLELPDGKVMICLAFLVFQIESFISKSEEAI